MKVFLRDSFAKERLEISFRYTFNLRLSLKQTEGRNTRDSRVIWLEMAPVDSPQNFHATKIVFYAFYEARNNS